MGEGTRDPVRDQRRLAMAMLRKWLEEANQGEAINLEDAEMVALVFRQEAALTHLPGYDASANQTAMAILEDRLENDHYNAAFYREEAGLLSRFLAVIEQLQAEEGK